MLDFSQQFLEQQESTPRQLLILIGLALSASELLPLGKPSLCPLLWLLADYVSSGKVLGSAHSSLSKFFSQGIPVLVGFRVSLSTSNYHKHGCVNYRLGCPFFYWSSTRYIAPGLFYSHIHEAEVPNLGGKACG